MREEAETYVFVMYIYLFSRFRCGMFFNENSEIVFLKIKLVCLFCFFLKTYDFKCNLVIVCDHEITHTSYAICREKIYVKLYAPFL